MNRSEPMVSTFSIVAYDPVSMEWGIAVASKFLAVGAVVPWARAGVGAIATQAFANLSFGPNGLRLLRDGKSAQQTLEKLLADDEGREHRQVGIVDGSGTAVTFTGSQCFDWAGGASGEGYAIQGNILTGGDVVESIRDAFLGKPGSLADRLIQALLAGDRAGGDSRGRQSAGILVVREAGGYGGHTDRALDLRVDDHPDPVPELIRLRSLHTLYLERPAEGDIIEIGEVLGKEIQDSLSQLGVFRGRSTGTYDEATSAALSAYMGKENLEERWLEGARIDRKVLEYLRAQVTSTR